jgi:hypothetical protein
LSGGIRRFYDSIADPVEGLKDGVLLEAGFDDVSPNEPNDISSWAYDYAVGKVDIIDNRARCCGVGDAPGFYGRRSRSRAEVFCASRGVFDTRS